MLQTDPSKRPTIGEVIFHLENISQTKSVSVGENLDFLKKTDLLLHQPNTSTTGTASSTANYNQPNLPAASNLNQNSWMGNAASLFKGNSLMKTIKDASSKVIDSVQ